MGRLPVQRTARLAVHAAAADRQGRFHRIGGAEGGEVVFEGSPGDLGAARSTFTGQHLAADVGA